MKKTYKILIFILIFFSSFSLFKESAFCLDFTDLFATSDSEKASAGSGKIFYFLPPQDDKDFFSSISDLSICRSRHVRKFIFLYLNEGREYLTAALTRSNRYLRRIEEIFSENSDIPKDIALLPLLESAFNPYAVSRSKAVGLWQFLKGTSRPLKLKVNNWVDERRNVEKSTQAAIKHLRNLYSMFGSWELALASYNGGAGYIKRSMIKTRSRSVTELLESGYLKRETNEYLYRFAALLVIYKNQKLFDIGDEAASPIAAETEKIVFEYPVKIKVAATLADVPVETLKSLNPELNQNITPPFEKKYTLIVPKGCKAKLENNITSLYDIKFNNLKKHVVKKGECISRIASLYKTQVKKIMLFNNLKNPGSIKPGLELYIPI
ncbi:MAG: transglycosylase SLT domain-containing protein [Spirochaetota bacterium]